MCNENLTSHGVLGNLLELRREAVVADEAFALHNFAPARSLFRYEYSGMDVDDRTDRDYETYGDT